MSAAASEPPSDPAEILAAIVEGLCGAIAARCAKERPASPIARLAWTRLRRLAVWFAALMAEFRAGRLAAASAALRRGPAVPALPRVPASPPPRLPRGFGWLIRLVPEAICFAGQVEHWLSAPELAPLLAASPQARRRLRPLCRMPGIRPGPALSTPRREPPAPLAAAPNSGPAAPAPSGAADAGHAPPRLRGVRTLRAAATEARADPPPGLFSLAGARPRTHAVNVAISKLTPAKPESRSRIRHLVHRFHEIGPMWGILRVTERVVGRGVNVTAGAHGSTSASD